MQLEWWHIGGLMLGIGQAAYLLLNQQLKLEPRLLMFWRGFGITALALPVCLYLDNWPQDPVFYAAAIATGLLVGFFDRLLFQFSAQYGAGVVSRLMALSLPLALLFWTLLHPEHIAVLRAKPHIMWLPVALLGTLVSVMLLKRDPVSKAAVIGLMPLYLMGATIDVLNKTAMSHGNGLPAFCAYTLLVSLWAGIINLFWPTKGTAPLTRTRIFSIWKGGLLIVLISGTYMVTKASSIASTPNPAFITALNLTAPFWVMLWNIWRKHPDNTNIIAGLGCVISALLLVFATL